MSKPKLRQAAFNLLLLFAVIVIVLVWLDREAVEQFLLMGLR